MAHDPREPLTPEEAAVARAYTALPRPEPSPALDARVLAQAREALAPPAARRRPRRPWYLLPGTGVAAAAVLAAGLAWQVGLLGDGRVQDLSSGPAPAAAPAARMEARDDRLDVELLERKQAAESPAESESESESEAFGGATATPPAARPAPKAEAPPPGTQSIRQRAERAPQAFPAPAPPPSPPPVFAEPTPMSTPAPAPAAPAPVERARAAADADEPDDATLDAITVTGSRIGRASSALPPWTEDARLAPAEWLDRVRDRVRAGDREGARMSLRRFVRQHPSQPVPDDLTLLLVQ